MNNTISGLYEIILQRKGNAPDGSYTKYLFDQGLDKILKKVGEESTETVIAAKNNDHDGTVNEVCDLFYHLLILLAQQDIHIDEVTAVLEERRQKTGNLKQIKTVDKNT